MTTNLNPVQLAVTHFRNGDYEQAKRYYEQAAQKYGRQLFEGSIRLCESKLGTALPNLDSVTVADQLTQTQQLLEQYYQRYQALRFQLLDQK